MIFLYEERYPEYPVLVIDDELGAKRYNTLENAERFNLTRGQALEVVSSTEVFGFKRVVYRVVERPVLKEPVFLVLDVGGAVVRYFSSDMARQHLGMLGARGVAVLKVSPSDGEETVSVEVVR